MFPLTQLLPELLALVVAKVEDGKNALRLTCRCLKQAVDATTTQLTWRWMSCAPGYVDLTAALGRISCPALIHLRCGNLITLTSLAGCPPGLRNLDFNNSGVASLAGCPPGLWRLECHATAVTSLAGCPPALRRLDCSSTRLASLAGCPPSVRRLKCNNSGVASLEPLAACAELEDLDCSDTGVSSLTALAGCPKLGKLIIYGTRVEDLTPLESHKELSWYVRLDAMLYTDACFARPCSY